MDGKDSRVMSYDEAARDLNVTKQSIRNFAKEGFLDNVKPKGRKKGLGITRESIDRFLKVATKRDDLAPEGVSP